MSDAEDGEAFDKEAEKEKLREQLAREEENRRSTQHMSELLLKGATMTNKHCDACGDPLFRHDGREFCPTCGVESGGEGDGGGESREGPTADVEVPGPEAAGPGGVETEAGEVTDRSADVQTEPDRDEDAGTAQARSERAGVASHGAGSRPAGGAASGDVGEAREALVRKLSALAREAEATDDVGRTRELLAATREAAEALAAIDSLRG